MAANDKTKRLRQENPYPLNPEWTKYLMNTKVENLQLKEGVIFICKRDDKVMDVWQGLIKHNFLSVPVLQKTKNKYYGFVDMADIVHYIVESFGKSKLEGSEDYWKLVKEDEIFQKKAINDIMVYPLQRRNPFHEIPVGYSLFSAIEALAKVNGLHRVPIVDSNRKLINVITQSQLIETLDANLALIGKRKEKPIGEIKGAIRSVYCINEETPAIEGFRQMTVHGVSGLAVVNTEGKLEGNLSIRDLKAICSDGRMFWRLYQTTKNFLQKVKKEYHEKHGIPNHPVFLKTNNTIEFAIKQLVTNRIHRIFIVDDANKPIGILSLKDILLELITDV